MNTKKIYKILDRHRRINYNSKAEYGRSLGLDRKKITNFLNNLNTSVNRMHFNRVCKIVEQSGFRIVVLDKDDKEIIID